jgi:hypothetical protein
MGVWLKYQGSAVLDVTGATNNAITLSLFNSTDSLSTVASKSITDVAVNIFPGFPANPFQGTDYSNPGGTPITNTLLIYSTASSGTGYNVVTPATAQISTQYLTVNPTFGQYTTGNNYRINAQVDINFIRTTAGTTATDQVIFYLSPLVVFYQW